MAEGAEAVAHDPTPIYWPICEIYRHSAAVTSASVRYWTLLRGPSSIEGTFQRAHAELIPLASIPAPAAGQPATVFEGDS